MRAGQFNQTGIIDPGQDLPCRRRTDQTVMQGAQIKHRYSDA